ncbi:MAG: hypothetical protein ACW980_25430 [Promethearchaeota archaeon]|jgi:hypothetical protein
MFTERFYQSIKKLEKEEAKSSMTKLFSSADDEKLLESFNRVMEESTKLLKRKSLDMNAMKRIDVLHMSAKLLKKELKKRSVIKK